MNVPQPWKTIPPTSHGPMNLLGRVGKIIFNNLLYSTQNTDLDHKMHLKAFNA
jgi:hypothetical protein